MLYITLSSLTFINKIFKKIILVVITYLTWRSKEVFKVGNVCNLLKYDYHLLFFFLKRGRCFWIYYVCWIQLFTTACWLHKIKIKIKIKLKRVSPKKLKKKKSTSNFKTQTWYFFSYFADYIHKNNSSLVNVITKRKQPKTLSSNCHLVMTNLY